MQYKIEGQHDSYPEGNPGKEDLSHWHYGADDETQPTLGEHDAEPGQEGLEVGSETQVQ